MQERHAIYLDSSAGTLIEKEHLAEVSNALGRAGLDLGNPSSPHAHGRAAKSVLLSAGSRIIQSVNAPSDSSVVLTSSGTEANQLAITSAFAQARTRHKRPHWILSAGEHDSVERLVTPFTSAGGRVDLIPLDSSGNPRLDLLEELRTPETCLLSLIWVHNETGVISDVEFAARWAQSHGIPLQVDAAQAWGRVPMDLGQLGAPYVCVSGSKIGAFSGTGAVICGPSVGLHAQILGSQARGARGGTENVLGALSLGLCAEKIAEKLVWEAGGAHALKLTLEGEVLKRIPGARVHGGSARRVAGISSFGFEGIEREGLVTGLDLMGYSVSAGSACAAGSAEASKTLQAMGWSAAQAKGSLRVSPGPASALDVTQFVTDLLTVISRLRKVHS